VVKTRASILIDQPPTRVFEFVAVDFANNYRRWSPEVQQLTLLTPGPLRVGSQARQVRLDQGRRTETTFRVIEMSSPDLIVFAENARQFRIEYRMEPVAERTRLTFAFDLARLELYMRPFEKLIRMAVQEGAERVVHNIKGLIEKDFYQNSGGQA
jgi:hypothetical protein